MNDVQQSAGLIPVVPQRAVRRVAAFSLVVTLALLSGCGFQLRGMGSDHLALDSINVTAKNEHGAMQRALERAMTEAGVKLAPAGKAPYSVHLLSEETTRRSVATSSDVTVSEYGLKLEVEFALDNAAGKAVIAPTSVSTERIYRFDNTSLVGNTEEEKLLNQEMRRDIASQIIRRIDATVRTAGAKAQ